jgi:glutathione S-transferase
MIAIHHLDDSRSQRILGLLEELGQPYEIIQHKRDPDSISEPVRYTFGEASRSIKARLRSTPHA